MIVAAGALEGQEHRLGHRPAGQHEAFTNAKIVEPTLFGHHAVLGGVEIAHAAPAARSAAIRSAEKPISPSTSSVCWPTDGTSPIGAASSVNVNGGSNAWTGPASVFTVRHLSRAEN